jgi:ABC-type cobalamin transport system ATPase subunit
VEKYSRLEANFSEISKDSVTKKHRLPIFNEISSLDFTEKEKTTELNFIKEKLKLDEKIEGKLNKIMKKNMNDN